MNKKPGARQHPASHRPPPRRSDPPAQQQPLRPADPRRRSRPQPDPTVPLRAHPGTSVPARQRFTLRQIEAFAATVRLGSVSAAAARLSRTQSAVSMALADLESALDTTLFERQGRRLAPTDAANRLLPHAIELLDRAADLGDRAAGTAAGPATLALGASRTIGPFVMPALIGAARRHLPGLRMRLTVANSEDLLVRVAAFELDCAFVEGPVTDTDLARERWLTDRLCLFARAGHPVFGQPGSLSSRLARWEWVLREPGSGTREIFLRAMGDVLPATPVIAAEVNEVETQKRLVRSSDWLSCIGRRALARDPAEEGLRELPLPGKLDRALTRRFWIVHNPARFRSEALEALLTAARGLRNESSG